jgi:hypothetical protein
MQGTESHVAIFLYYAERAVAPLGKGARESLLALVTGECQQAAG